VNHHIVAASIPLHHEVQKFSSGTDSLEWSQNNNNNDRFTAHEKGRKTVVVVLVLSQEMDWEERL